MTRSACFARLEAPEVLFSLQGSGGVQSDTQNRFGGVRRIWVQAMVVIRWEGLGHAGPGV